MSALQNILRQLPGIHNIDPLLVFGIVLIAGAAGGWLAGKIKLPSITGNILAGVLIGPSMLGLIGESTFSHLTPLSTFAMGLITVSIGGHLSYRRIHNALGRIVLITLGEVALCFVFVALTVRYYTGSGVLAILLGSLALSTAPGTNVALMREYRAKGSFVKTLLSVVAMDNILAIVIFVFCLTMMRDFFTGERGQMHWINAIIHPVAQLSGSLLLGWSLGKITEWMIHRPQFNNFSTVFIAILLCAGLGKALGLNPLLASLFFGVCLGNSSREVEAQLKVLAPIEGLLYVTFFTLAGVMLHLNRLPEAGLLGAAYFLARVAGKGAGAMLGGVLAGSSRRIWRNVPLGLVPQAGLVIALLVITQEQSFIPDDVKSLVATLVLAVVVVNEMLGPLTVRLALKRTQEMEKDRPRLVEFIQEEFIMMNLEAEDKWDAIRRLCDFLILTHHVEHIDSQALFDSVTDRERQETTAIGRGVAIPHGIIESGPEIQGVLGISRKGIDFGAPDGQPVNIIMLICTPRDHQKRHLQVLAGLAAMVADADMRFRLIGAPNANDAWEILEYSERPNYNHFLED